MGSLNVSCLLDGESFWSNDDEEDEDDLDDDDVTLVSSVALYELHRSPVQRQADILELPDIS